jgi:hypothetical protein
MWNDTQTNGAGTHGVHDGYGSYAESSYGQAAASPHPVEILTEPNAPSRGFVEDLGIRGAESSWEDRLAPSVAQFVDLGDPDPTLRIRIAIALGLVTLDPADPLNASYTMRLRGRLVVPRDLARRTSAVPIVIIVMGNHGVLKFVGTTPTEIRNFEGYDYLQQSLADLGIASCSVDTNYANGFDLPIRARAEIILDTIAMIRVRMAAATLAKIDFDRLGFVGHSRGGDAVVMAEQLAARRALPFQTRFVASIAPTDFTVGTKDFLDARLPPAPIPPPPAVRPTIPTASRVPVPIRVSASVRYLVLLGAHDGDVSGPQSNGFGHYDRAPGDKSLIFARGLTHNRFNTVWNECADYADGRNIFVQDDDCRTRGPNAFDQRIFAAVVHREYAKFYVGALARRTLLADATAEDVLRGIVAPSRAQLRQSAGLAGPAASIQWSVTSALTVDELDTAGIGARAPASATIEVADASRPTVPHITSAFVARTVGDKLRVECGGANVSARTELTFRLTSMIPTTSERVIDAARAPDWEVRLVTGPVTGSTLVTTVCRPANLDRRGLRDPNKPFFCRVYEPSNAIVGGPGTMPIVNVTKNQFDTLTLPLSAFAGANLRDVRSVEFEARGGVLPLLVDSIAFV